MIHRDFKLGYAVSSRKLAGLSEKRGVLVVDDDAVVVDTLKEYLTAEDYNVVTSGTRRCIKQIKKKFFDVTLLDIKLPDMMVYNC